MSLLSILPALNLVANKLLDYIPDPAEKARAAKEFQEKLLALAQSVDAGQAEIDRTEANSASLFVSGWRPAIGWVCAACLALYYLPSFVIGEAFWVEACWGSAPCARLKNCKVWRAANSDPTNAVTSVPKFTIKGQSARESRQGGSVTPCSAAPPRVPIFLSFPRPKESQILALKLQVRVKKQNKPDHL